MVAEIETLDFVVALDFRDIAGEKEASLMEDRRRDVEVAHEGHVVLDDEHRRPARRDLADDGHRLLCLDGRHSGSRFVQQKQGRGGRHGHAEAQPLPLAMRQFLREEAPLVRQREAPKMCSQMIFEMIPIEQALQRQAQIVLDGEFAEHAKRLRLHRYAEPRSLEGIRARDVLAAEIYAASISSVATDEQLEEGALAGSIRTDDTAGLTGVDGPRHVVDGFHAAEMFGEVVDGKQHGSVLRHRSLRCTLAAKRARDEPAKRLHTLWHD